MVSNLFYHIYHQTSWFFKKNGECSFIFCALFLELLERVPVCAAQTGSRASRQLIQSYPNSATPWVANMSALPHKDLCVGLINAKILWAEHTTKCSLLGQIVNDFGITDFYPSRLGGLEVSLFLLNKIHLKPDKHLPTVGTHQKCTETRLIEPPADSQPL